MCVGQVNAYIDDILFDQDGYEIDVIEPSFELIGTYLFWGDENIYKVDVRER